MTKSTLPLLALLALLGLHMVAMPYASAQPEQSASVSATAKTKKHDDKNASAPDANHQSDA